MGSKKNKAFCGIDPWYKTAASSVCHDSWPVMAYVKNFQNLEMINVGILFPSDVNCQWKIMSTWSLTQHIELLVMHDWLGEGNYANPVYGVATICHQVRW